MSRDNSYYAEKMRESRERARKAGRARIEMQLDPETLRRFERIVTECGSRQAALDSLLDSYETNAA